MKNILKILLIFFYLSANSQDVNGNKISKVFQVEGVNANDLFAKLNVVIANTYNSANDVVQLSDAESKKMVIKAIATIRIPNQARHYIGMAPDYADRDHDYTLNIAARDGRYKVEIDYQRGKTEYGVARYLPIMNPSDEYKAQQVDLARERAADAILVGKKKKERLYKNIPIDLETYATNLKNYANELFDRIFNEVLKANKDDDDW